MRPFIDEMGQNARRLFVLGIRSCCGFKRRGQGLEPGLWPPPERPRISRFIWEGVPLTREKSVYQVLRGHRPWFLAIDTAASPYREVQKSFAASIHRERTTSLPDLFDEQAQQA